jgi:lipoprotein LprG
MLRLHTTPAPRARRRCYGLAGAVTLVAVLIAGCSQSTPKGDPSALLSAARQKLDAASSLHFSLTSNVPDRGKTTILAGKGDLERPDSIAGSFTISVSGFPAEVKVVSKGGVFAAQLPFAVGYVKTDPSRFGLENPAQLMDPNSGITSLLGGATNPKMGPQVRLEGELLDTVTATVPGDKIPVLPDAAPQKPVALVALIDPHTDELRQISLTGPFTSSTSDGTYVLVLTAYDEHVDITLPSGI